MVRIRKGRRRFVVIVVAVVVLLVAGVWSTIDAVGDALDREQDRVDLIDLTRNTPWPGEKLLVPADMPEQGLRGSLNSTGFTVDFALAAPGGRETRVSYQIHHPFEDGSLRDGAACGATKILTCTDAGGGITKVITRRTDNSDPSAALYQRRGDRVVSVTVVTGPVDFRQLRGLLTDQRPVPDAELLRLLRGPGHRTGWS